MTPDDLDFLTTDAGGDLLALAAGLDWSRARLVASTAVVRGADPAHAAAAIDLVTARLRARGRIRGAERMLLTDEAVQQATAWPVAALRARRLAGRDVHDVTCSVGAELGELVRTADRGVGSDLAPAPPRRGGGGGTRAPGRRRPPLPALLAAARGRDHVIKCAPGLDTSVLDHAGEVELVSLDGSVREACLWSPGLSAGVARRATVIRTVPAGDPGPWGPPRLVADGVAVHVGGGAGGGGHPAGAPGRSSGRGW